MTKYRCRFFGPPAPFAEASLAVATAEMSCAEIDDIAWIKAEALSRERSGRDEGFDLWQSNRLVYRHLDRRNGGDVALPQPRAANER